MPTRTGVGKVLAFGRPEVRHSTAIIACWSEVERAAAARSARVDENGTAKRVARVRKRFGYHGEGRREDAGPMITRVRTKTFPVVYLDPWHSVRVDSPHSLSPSSLLLLLFSLSEHCRFHYRWSVYDRAHYSPRKCEFRSFRSSDFRSVRRRLGARSLFFSAGPVSTSAVFFFFFKSLPPP